MNVLAHIRMCCPVSTLLFVLTLPATAQTPLPPAHAGPQQAAGEQDGQHDFDFLLGKWRVRNRRLLHPLTGSNDWIEFDGMLVVQPIWEGRANRDLFQADSPSGHIDGMTVRLHNPKSHQWSLYWASAATGVFEKPMIGQFKNGRGEFFDQEDFVGKAIYVRFVWSNITPNSCRWEQAFSDDGGKTWETNWIMTFTREKQQ